MQLIALAPEQPPQERHPAGCDRALELRAGEAVNLKQQQSRLLTRALGWLEPEVAHRPLIAAQPPAHAMDIRFQFGKHGAFSSPSTRRRLRPQCSGSGLK